MLAKECGLTPLDDGSYDTKRMRCIIQEFVAVAYSVQDPTTAGEEIKTEGSALNGSGLTPKVIVSAMEKADVIHRVRMACALLDTKSMKQGIVATCKGAGPDVGPARRDTSLPVWWTEEHDINLLLLVASQSMYGQWKKLSSNKLISDAPSGFVMPQKIQGFEWVTALTPKLVEKRIAALGEGLKRYITSLQGTNELGVEMPPASPERVAGGKKTVTAKMKGKGSSKAHVPLVTKNPNYQRPTWIKSFKEAVHKPKTDTTKEETNTGGAYHGAAALRNISLNKVKVSNSTSIDLTPKTEADPAVERAIGKANMSMVPLAGLSPMASPPKRSKVEKSENEYAKPEQNKKEITAVMSSVVTVEKQAVDSLQSITVDAAAKGVHKAAKKSLSEVFSNAGDIVNLESEDKTNAGITPAKGLTHAAHVTPATVGEKRVAVVSKESTMKKFKATKTKGDKADKMEKEKPLKPVGNIMNFFEGKKVEIVE